MRHEVKHTRIERARIHVAWGWRVYEMRERWLTMGSDSQLEAFTAAVSGVAISL